MRRRRCGCCLRTMEVVERLIHVRQKPYEERSRKTLTFLSLLACGVVIGLYGVYRLIDYFRKGTSWEDLASPIIELVTSVFFLADCFLFILHRRFYLMMYAYIIFAMVVLAALHFFLRRGFNSAAGLFYFLIPHFTTLVEMPYPHIITVICYLVLIGLYVYDIVVPPEIVDIRMSQIIFYAGMLLSALIFEVSFWSYQKKNKDTNDIIIRVADAISTLDMEHDDVLELRSKDLRYSSQIFRILKRIIDNMFLYVSFLPPSLKSQMARARHSSASPSGASPGSRKPGDTTTGNGTNRDEASFSDATTDFSDAMSDTSSTLSSALSESSRGSRRGRRGRRKKGSRSSDSRDGALFDTRQDYALFSGDLTVMVIRLVSLTTQIQRVVDRMKEDLEGRQFCEYRTRVDSSAAIHPGNLSPGLGLGRHRSPSSDLGSSPLTRGRSASVSVLRTEGSGSEENEDEDVDVDDDTETEMSESEKEDQEAMLATIVERQQMFLDRVSSVIGRHRGLVHDYRGGIVICSFNTALQRCLQHSEQACRAAFELVRAFKPVEENFNVRMAVCRGVALYGNTGCSAIRRFEVMGDPVRRAIGLMDGCGELLGGDVSILIDESVKQRVRFEYDVKIIDHDRKTDQSSYWLVGLKDSFNTRQNDEWLYRISDSLRDDDLSARGTSDGGSERERMEDYLVFGWNAFTHGEFEDALKYCRLCCLGTGSELGDARPPLRDLPPHSRVRLMLLLKRLQDEKVNTLKRSVQTEDRSWIDEVMKKC